MRGIVGVVLAAVLIVGPGCKTEAEGAGKPVAAGALVRQLIGAPSFSPCGKWMVYAADADLWLRPTGGEGKPINITAEVPPPPEPAGAPPAPNAAPARPPTPAEIAQGPQAGWKYDPAWSPDGLAFAFAAVRSDANPDTSDDGDMDIWVLRYPRHAWMDVAEADVRLGGPTDVDETGANGFFRDVCPPAPTDAAGKPRPENAAELQVRLAGCTRYLTLPGVYVQVTRDPGQETGPIWLPGGKQVAFHSSNGGYWLADLPVDLMGPPGEGGCGCRHHGDETEGEEAAEGEGGCGCAHGGGPGGGGCPHHMGGAPGEGGGCPHHMGGASGEGGGCGCKHEGAPGSPPSPGGCPFHQGGPATPPPMPPMPPPPGGGCPYANQGMGAPMPPEPPVPPVPAVPPVPVPPAPPPPPAAQPAPPPAPPAPPPPPPPAPPATSR